MPRPSRAAPRRGVMFVAFDPALDWSAYDYVIIGAGPAELFLAEKFASNGRVLILEAGGRDLSQAAGAGYYDLEVTGRSYDSLGQRLSVFGGTSNHWAAIRTIEPDDLREPARLSGVAHCLCRLCAASQGGAGLAEFGGIRKGRQCQRRRRKSKAGPSRACEDLAAFTSSSPIRCGISGHAQTQFFLPPPPPPPPPLEPASPASISTASV